MQDNTTIVASGVAPAKPARVHPRMGHARGLYLITPDEQDTLSLTRRVAAVLPHAAWLQYRNKQADAALRVVQAQALRAMCTAAGVRLVVNDDPGLALACDADGVHLGEHDADLRSARALLGESRFIGVSCYDDLARARQAVMAGADYVAFGAFQPSATKPGARRAGLPLLGEAAALGVPVVAIGGIGIAQAAAIQAAGADLVAVISGVFGAHDPVAAARGYHAALTRTTTPSS